MKKKSQILIRSAREEDFDHCLHLDHSLETKTIWQMQLQEDEGRTQVSFETLRLPRPIRVEYPRRREELTLELTDPQQILVAESEGILLGYSHFTLTASSRSVSVRNLVVDEPWRRRRVGRALLEQTIAWGRLHEARRITFEATSRSYPAIQFLLARGLTFCGYNDRYYPSQDIAVFFGQNV